MRLKLILLGCFLLAGCVGNPPRQADPSSHDLGDAGTDWPASQLMLSGFRVRAVTWLESAALLYQLAYADDQSRHAYANHRWVAPPAELIERALQRRLVSARPDEGGTGCRIVLSLDELQQRFSAADRSQVVLQARASLLRPYGEARLARRAFTVTQEAPTPDARGGVQATRLATNRLAEGLARWTDALAAERPELVNICKEQR